MKYVHVYVLLNTDNYLYFSLLTQNLPKLNALLKVAPMYGLLC